MQFLWKSWPQRDCFEKDKNASKRPRGWKSNMNQASGSSIDICLACADEAIEEEITVDHDNEEKVIDIGVFDNDDSCCKVILSSTDDEDNLYYFDADDYDEMILTHGGKEVGDATIAESNADDNENKIENKNEKIDSKKRT